MSEQLRKLERDFKSMSSILLEKERELLELREWKSRVMLYLPLAEDKILFCMKRSKEENDQIFLENLTANLKELTELLTEGRNDNVPDNTEVESGKRFESAFDCLAMEEGEG